MRNNPRIYDKDLYKYRNLIERMFLYNMKQFRRAITRYDKLDASYCNELSEVF
jgi:transposase